MKGGPKSGGRVPLSGANFGCPGRWVASVPRRCPRLTTGRLSDRLGSGWLGGAPSLSRTGLGIQLCGGGSVWGGGLIEPRLAFGGVPPDLSSPYPPPSAGGVPGGAEIRIKWRDDV